MTFTLSFLTKIYRLGLFLVLGLIVIDLFVFLFFPDTLAGDLFLATREQTPLTWVSALAMFFLALASFAIYEGKQEKAWVWLSAIFLYFSIDDAVYLHERVSGYLRDHTDIFGSFPSNIWVLMYFPLLAFSLSALLYLLWRDAIRNSKQKILIALFMLGVAIFFDLVDGFMLKNDTDLFCLPESCHLILVHLMRLTEEILEVLALGILGYELIREHCLDMSDRSPREKKS